MSLNKAGGEMYPWADYTWNPLAGKCPHDCLYCYMKSPPICWSDKYKGAQRIWEKELDINLSNRETIRKQDLTFVPRDKPLIFVCSGNDLATAPNDTKLKILRKCNEEPDNYYLIQSKNPTNLKNVENEFPPNLIIGTTIETNRSKLCEDVSNTPVPKRRAESMEVFYDYHRMVSIEPVMDFDLKILVSFIRNARPNFVSIGADSKGHKLREPGSEKIESLIKELEEFTEVRTKKNLNRLIKERGTPS